jgi:hypothetical protein
MAPNAAAQPKRKRRWLQFSLRSLLSFVFVCAVLCGWFAAKMREAMAQQAAVESLRKNGGHVWYGYEFDASGNWDSNANTPGPIWMRRLLGDDFFATVVQVRARNDAGLENLAGLNHIQRVDLIGDKFTETGLDRLKGLPRLERLTISSYRYPFAVQRHLNDVSTLKSLDLSSNSYVYNEGLQHLKGFVQLQALDLGFTFITDAGLPQLYCLQTLKRLGLHGTRVTDNGVAKLQRELPTCKIER